MGAQKGSDRQRDLVLRAQRGDVLALDELLQQLLPLVTRICRRFAGTAWEDALQESLIVVFRRLRTLEQPEALVAWVATSARREALRQSRLPEHESLPEAAAAQAPDSELDLTHTLATLPAQQREVLVLRDLVGLSEEETAELLLVPRGTVKSRLYRARRTFRKAWSDEP